MNAAQKRLAQAIRVASQPPPKTKAQRGFERFLKCKSKNRQAAAKLIEALNTERHSRASAEPLTPPPQVLPPMF